MRAIAQMLWPPLSCLRRYGLGASTTYPIMQSNAQIDVIINDENVRQCRCTRCGNNSFKANRDFREPHRSSGTISSCNRTGPTASSMLPDDLFIELLHWVRILAFRVPPERCGSLFALHSPVLWRRIPRKRQSRESTRKEVSSRIFLKNGIELR
jgi:hypothetical protein